MGTTRSPMSRWCTKLQAWPKGPWRGCTRRWATSKSKSRVSASTRCRPRAANASYGVLSIGLCELPMPSVTCAMPRSCRPRRLAERGDDVLGEQLHLPLLLVPGHEALIEEPAEPLEIALAADLLQRLDL